MLFKAFAAAGLILTSFSGVAGAYTAPGFPQVNIVSPNAHIDLLPGAFNMVAISNALEGQNTPSVEKVNAVNRPAMKPNGPVTLSKLVQLPPPILIQMGDISSSSSQNGSRGGSGPGGSQN